MKGCSAFSFEKAIGTPWDKTLGWVGSLGSHPVEHYRAMNATCLLSCEHQYLQGHFNTTFKTTSPCFSCTFTC